MTAGSILKEQLLVIEEYTVKTDEDIEKGEIVYNDGTGVLAAPNTAIGPFMMSLKDHDYSEETSHKVSCVAMGCVEAQKVSGSGGGKKGQAVMISATAGEVTLFVKGDAPASYAESTVQTALDTNIGLVGTLAEDAADGDTSAKIWLGVK
ncbi:MAG: hypothetical protein NWE89_11800 [Candidatus Bathyarchaeota archaeon]|nr:hypothetical protein [Candidatus Bathyarchaeota archaeon]